MRTCDNDADTFFTSSGGSPPTVEAEALAYARQGLPLVPLKPGRKDPWKRPPGYQNLPPATESDIRSWFAEEPSLNVGLLTGHGIIVIDVDEHDGKMSGAEALAALEGIYGPLPVTLTSITGSGGRHLIFRLPPGYDFGNRLPVISEWLRTTTGKATGGVIDVRGDGGLIVLPPSIHPNGTLYRWEDPDVPIATLPLAWCQTPEPLPFDDPERPRRGKSRQASRLKVKDLSRRDRLAHEHMANVDPGALLGKDTLLLLEAEVEKSTDRTHRMWQIILGAASSRFDPDRLYDLMVNSPLEAGLREHGGREWFHARMIEAHRYLAENILAVEELRVEVEEYDWTTTPYMTKTGRTSKAAPGSMKVVLHEALDEAVRQATTEPLLIKSKMAVALSVSRKTVVNAFGGLTKLGWLEEIPEPYRHFDDPVIYRLLPAESRLQPPPPQSFQLDPSLEAKTQDTAVLLSVPSTTQIPSTVSGCNPLGLEASKGLLGTSTATLSAPTSENAAEVLLNFEDPPEPPRTKKRADPWRTNTCRKCGEPTLTMRDADDPDRPFRVDAQPSPIGHWIVVDDHWQILQGKGRTDHERNHDETGRSYYARHNCSTPPQQSAQPTAGTTEPSCNSKEWTR